MKTSKKRVARVVYVSGCVLSPSGRLKLGADVLMKCDHAYADKVGVLVFAPDYTYPEGSVLLNYFYFAVTFPKHTEFHQLQSCSDGNLRLVKMPDYSDKGLETTLNERADNL